MDNQEELQLIRQEIRRVERSTRMLKQMVARLIEREANENRQSEEDTRDHERHTD